MKNSPTLNTEEPMLQELEEMLIGLHKEKLLMLRIKDNAVHAGHSLLLLLLKAVSSLLAKTSFSLNNNLLIAQEPMETKGAVEVGWTLPSNTSLTTVSPPKINIPMLLEIKSALKTVEMLKFLDLSMFKDVIILRMLLAQDQFQ